MAVGGSHLVADHLLNCPLGFGAFRSLYCQFKYPGLIGEVGSLDGGL